MRVEDAKQFAPASCEFWQPNRIPYSPLRPRVEFMRWFQSDSEQNYEKQGNKAFSVESVGYEFNALGYRGPDFGRQPGEGSVMFVGDSNTVGVGLPWDRLWTTQVTARLEERWGKPVRQCNLGFGGTSSDYAAMMVHQAVDVIRPDAVFVLWSFISRITWFANPQLQIHFYERPYSFHAQEHAAFLRLATESQCFFNFVRNFTLVRERLLRQGVPFYWGTMEEFPPGMLDAYLPLEGYVGQLETLDLARDGMHAGLKSHAAFAERVMATLDRNAANGLVTTSSSSNSAPAHPVPSIRTAPATAFAKRDVDDAAATQGPAAPWMAPIRGVLDSIRLRRRMRAFKRKSPFIY